MWFCSCFLSLCCFGSFLQETLTRLKWACFVLVTAKLIIYFSALTCSLLPAHSSKRVKCGDMESGKDGFPNCLEVEYSEMEGF